MKVYRVREEIFNRALSYLGYNENWKFEIFEMNLWSDKDSTRTYGVNWSACGTQSVEDTQKFIDQMQFAVELTKMLNDCKIVLRNYDDEDDTIATKEDFEKAYEYMIIWLKNKDFKQIKKFLEC